MFSLTTWIFLESLAWLDRTSLRFIFVMPTSFLIVFNSFVMAEFNCSISLITLPSKSNNVSLMAFFMTFLPLAIACRTGHL